MTAAEVARSYVESFASHDPERIAAHVADGFVNDHASALASGCEGRDEYRRRLPGFLASFPGLRYDVDAVIADGDLVAVTYRMTATPPEGNIDIRGVMVIDVDVDARLVTRRTDYWDSLTVLRQTGQA